MIFYALSFLSGILWIHIKWVAFLINLLLIIISLQKRLELLHIFILIICLFSGLTLEHFHNEYNLNKDKFLKSNSNISTEVQFVSRIEKQERQLKGIFELRHQPFVYYLYSNNLKEKDLENKSCVIKGKVISVLNHTPYVSISNVDLNSCHITKRKNIIEKQRDFIIKKLNNSSLSHPEYVIALVTGDVNGINTDFIDKVKDIGIYHLLAVSGSHIATISFLIYHPLVRLNIPKVIINGLIILFLSIFAYYTGFAPSALRAILATTTVILISNKTKIASIDILGLIFLVMIIFNPDYLYDIGFQFSFIISFFIILSFPLIKKLTFFKNIFVLTFIAQLSSTIISIYHFNQIQWIGLLSNLIFVPFYSFIIFPLSIFLFFAYHFVSDMTLINLVFDKIYIVHNKLLDLFLTFKYYQIFNVRPNVSTITFFDVGQGDSLIFQTTKQETVMVDTGGKEIKIGNIDNHNIAKYHIMPTLKQKRITKIDHLIITHPHADHIGELPYIAQHIRIKKLYINLYSYSEIELIKIKRLCKINNIELIDATTIQFIQLKNSKISFLHGDIPNSNDKNEHSIILLIEYQRYKMLLMGDATKNNESKLMKIYQLPKIDILKVGHHGSKTSSSESFINLIKPTISIISSGKNNKYHLPNRETLQTLRSTNSSILNTQDVGEITLDLDHDLDIKSKN